MLKLLFSKKRPTINTINMRCKGCGAIPSHIVLITTIANVYPGNKPEIIAVCGCDQSKDYLTSITECLGVIYSEMYEIRENQVVINNSFWTSL